MNVALVRERVFANGIIEDLEKRASWVIQVGAKFNDKYPYERQKRRRHRERGEGHVTMKAEVGVMQTQPRNS